MLPIVSFLLHARAHQVRPFFSIVRKSRVLPYGEGDGHPVSIQLESLTRRPLFFPMVITEALAVGGGEGKRSVLLLNASLNVSDVDQVPDKVFGSHCESCSVWFPCHPHHDDPDIQLGVSFLVTQRYHMALILWKNVKLPPIQNNVYPELSCR